MSQCYDKLKEEKVKVKDYEENCSYVFLRHFLMTAHVFGTVCMTRLMIISGLTGTAPAIQFQPVENQFFRKTGYLRKSSLFGIHEFHIAVYV